MIAKKNIVLQSPSGRPFLTDIFYIENKQKKPVVIFCHGFAGFKDWGAFNLMAEAFAEAGFIFVKHNFSHDGTTIDHPTEFVDLEAFGNNNFSKELDDIGVVIDWICSDNLPVERSEVNTNEIYLIGHSRGGGIVMLKAGEDPRVKKVAPWNSINEFGKYWKKDEMDKIKKDGVIYVRNSRTKQDLPLYWQMYEDYFAHMGRLYIPDVVRRLTIPMVIVHGTKDETVPFSAAQEMQTWKPDAELVGIEGANHVFGARHPWTQDSMPADLTKAVAETIHFFKLR
jgi:pimeloyl-ACP methyl ester carboxylesterase